MSDSELDPEVRHLLQAARGADEPTAADRERVRKALAGTLGAAAVGAPPATASAAASGGAAGGAGATATAATATTTVKLWVVLGVVGAAGLGATHVWRSSAEDTAAPPAEVSRADATGDTSVRAAQESQPSPSRLPAAERAAERQPAHPATTTPQPVHSPVRKLPAPPAAREEHRRPSGRTQRRAAPVVSSDGPRTQPPPAKAVATSRAASPPGRAPEPPPRQESAPATPADHAGGKGFAAGAAPAHQITPPVPPTPAAPSPAPAAAASDPEPAARAADAPVTPPQAEEASLEHELSLLQRAQTALRRGHHERALRLAESHAERFPRGHLVRERLAVIALARCGRGEDGGPAARALLQRAGATPLADRVRQACRRE